MKMILRYGVQLIRRLTAGITRMAFWLVCLFFCVYLYFALGSGWSDRRVLGTCWFYLDPQYCAAVCSPLLWIAVMAMGWRIAIEVISRFVLRRDTTGCVTEPANGNNNESGLISESGSVSGLKRGNRRWRYLLISLDWLGRIATVLAGAIVLTKYGYSIQGIFAPIGKYCHWLFDPIGQMILHGPNSPYLKDMSASRFLWLPLLMTGILIAGWFLIRYTSIVRFIRKTLAESWGASFIALGIFACLTVAVGIFFNWFIEGFYQVPVTVFMATGRITWPIFIIPGCLLCLFAMIVWCHGKRRRLDSQKDHEVQHE